MAKQDQPGGWRTRGRRLVLVGSALLLVLGAGGPVAAGPVQEDIEYPGYVWRSGVSEKARVEAAAPRRADLGAPIGLAIELGPFAEAVREKQQTEKPFAAPLIIGTHRELPAEHRQELGARDLVWEAAGNGGQVAVLSLHSPGARALRAAIDFHRLPRGAEVRFYSPAAPDRAVGPFEADFLVAMEKSSRREGPFWSPAITGDTLAVEIWIPGWDRADDVRLSLRTVSHIFASLEDKDLRHIGNSGSCNRDIDCFRKWTTAADGVAKIIFEVPGGSALCTGQLMANPKEKFLFLTASHCISSRQEAKSMTLFWFFQRAGCGGTNPTTVVQTGGGGKLKFTSYRSATGDLQTDHTLIQLRRDPPDGVAFLGWKIVAEPDDNVGEKTHGIHHPGGDVKMGSRGKVRDVWSLLADGSLVPAIGMAPTHYQQNWKKGTTEGGSSGSAILCGRRWPKQYVIGVLTGGFASCSARREPDFYGIFQETFERFRKFRKFFDS